MLNTENLTVCLCLLWLSKGWIMLSTGLNSIWWITLYVLLSLIGWIVIYPLVSVICPWHNWALQSIVCSICGVISSITYHAVTRWNLENFRCRGCDNAAVVQLFFGHTYHNGSNSTWFEIFQTILSVSFSLFNFDFWGLI